MNPNYELPNLGSSFQFVSTVEEIIETGVQPA